MLAASGGQRVQQQAGDSHRSHAAGNRGDGASGCNRAIEIHVTDQPALAFLAFDSVNTHIDHGSPGFDPVAFDHLRPAYRGYHDVGINRIEGEEGKSRRT